ncbi:MAG: GntR family transcriptional regulator [Succinivibrionaceae bacterium]|nr:GntR family transcriptional regulator [Succinivibrionaceae bacterium]
MPATPHARIPPHEFSPGRPLNLQAYDLLRSLIVNATLPPGIAFTANEVSAQLGISRQPVRDALMRLSRDGLVEVVPQSGCQVARISVGNIAPVCFIRSAIECACARAAGRLGAAEREGIEGQMGKCLMLQREAAAQGEAGHAAFSAQDDRFHELLCSLSGHTRPWEEIQDLKANVDRIRYLAMGRYPTLGALADEHAAILAALREGEVERCCTLIEAHDRALEITYVGIRADHPGWFLGGD